MKFKRENMAKMQFSYIPTVLVLIFVSVFPLINCNPPPKVFKDAPSLTIEGHVYPSSVKPPGSTKNFFLGGAGVRGLEFKGKFVKFTSIGIYLEETAIRSLSKWKAQMVEELANSKAFFYDIITGPFEKFTMITMIRPLTGKEYSTKVIQNFIAVWKADKKYGKEEEKATKQFLEIFKNESLPPGTSILFTQTPQGVLKIAFSKDSTIPAKDNAEIANKELSEAILYSIIGEHGVSPALKRKVAERMTKVLKTELTVQENNESKTQKQGKGSDSSTQQNKH